MKNAHDPWGETREGKLALLSPQNLQQSLVRQPSTHRANTENQRLCSVLNENLIFPQSISESHIALTCIR